MDTPESKPEMLPVTPATRSYVATLNEHNVLRREDDRAWMDEQVHEVLRALHVALAGGTVKIEIAERGASTIADDLDQQLEAALDESSRFPGGEVYF